MGQSLLAAFLISAIRFTFGFKLKAPEWRVNSKHWRSSQKRLLTIVVGHCEKSAGEVEEVHSKNYD
jgi:hypothetical protein